MSSTNRRRESGFTLVEMIVVTMLLAIAMVGLLAVFDASARINKNETDVADAQGAVRYGLYQMTRAIRMAGAGGLYVTQAVVNHNDRGLTGIAPAGASYDNTTGVTVTDTAAAKTYAVREGTDIIEIRGVILSPLIGFDQQTGCNGCTGSQSLTVLPITGNPIIGQHVNDDATNRPQFAAVDTYTASASNARPMLVDRRGREHRPPRRLLRSHARRRHAVSPGALQRRRDHDPDVSRRRNLQRGRLRRNDRASLQHRAAVHDGSGRAGPGDPEDPPGRRPGRLHLLHHDGSRHRSHRHPPVPGPGNAARQLVRRREARRGRRRHAGRLRRRRDHHRRDRQRAHGPAAGRAGPERGSERLDGRRRRRVGSQRDRRRRAGRQRFPAAAAVRRGARRHRVRPALPPPPRRDGLAAREGEGLGPDLSRRGLAGLPDHELDRGADHAGQLPAPGADDQGQPPQLRFQG